MNKKMLIVIFIIISLSLLACSFGNLISVTREGVPTETEIQTVKILEICSLVEKSDIEAILAEPASEPKNINGSCVFTNTKDSLYMLSIAIGQDEMAKGILEGQAMMMGFAGAPLDEARMAKLKSLTSLLDFKEFFSELVAAVEGVPTPKARLIDDPKSDVVYWAWITAQSRRQGALDMVRGPSIVNIHLIVSDTQSEESMLVAARALADKIFDRLPPKFSVAMPMETPDISGVNSSSSPVGTPTYIGGSTLVSNPTPIGTPTPIGVPTPVGPPTPVGIPTPVGPPTPVGGPTPIGGPTPVGGPTPIGGPTLVTQ